MSLLLESLRVENYRVFRRIEIGRLGRVNLFVGRNNAGKSSILEAVRLYASRGADDTLLSILESHDDLRIGGREADDRFLAVKQLFHGRDADWTDQSEIRIGPIDDYRRTLSIRITTVPAAHFQDRFRGVAQPTLFPDDGTDDGPRRLAVVTTFDDESRILPLDGDWRTWRVVIRRGEPTTRHAHVSPYGLSSDAAARLWDLIALTDLEQNVIEALRIISPEIERISFIGENSRSRVAVAKLASQSQPVALRSLGDGVNRMLGIALSLVSARGGVLLLDEVENGIHFSAQRRLWQLIFRLANRLETQVFGTTHSWDCIEAFQHAAAVDQNEEAALVRLDVHDDAVLTTMFSERDLAIVTREQIEVR